MNYAINPHRKKKAGAMIGIELKLLAHASFIKSRNEAIEFLNTGFYFQDQHAC